MPGHSSAAQLDEMAARVAAGYEEIAASLAEQNAKIESLCRLVVGGCALFGFLAVLRHLLD